MSLEIDGAKLKVKYELCLVLVLSSSSHVKNQSWILDLTTIFTIIKKVFDWDQIRRKIPIKGQLISKWFLMSSISSKKRTKIVRFHPKNDFRSFFWGNRRHHKVISKLTDLRNLFVVGGHTLITLGHKGTYLVFKMLTTVL